MEKKIRNAPGSRAILYARVSTEEQAGKDHFSIEAQLHEMRDLVQEKGWEIVGEFIDEGESGTKRDRPQLLAALKVAEKKGLRHPHHARTFPSFPLCVSHAGYLR